MHVLHKFGRYGNTCGSVFPQVVVELGCDDVTGDFIAAGTRGNQCQRKRV